MLNKKSPRAIQLQKDTKIKLMPHQLASIYKMIQIENNRTYVHNNFQYDLNYGFLANEVGSGKSYIVLELCNYNLTNNSIYNKINETSYLNHEENLNDFDEYKNNLVYFDSLNLALKDTNICFITVPTPSKSNGSFSLDNINLVLDDIGFFLINNYCSPV